MSEIKKTRPDVAASEREQEQRNTGKAFSVSSVDFTMRGKSTQAFIDYIPHGRSNAITAEQLGKRLSIPPRKVTLRVQAYRLRGAPICASNTEPYGYFMAESPAELGQYVRSLKGRANEVAATLNSLVNTLDAMTGQTRMEGF